MDQTTNDAIDYLFAIPPTHKLHDRHLGQVLDWVGDASFLRTTLWSSFHHLTEHGGHKSAEYSNVRKVGGIKSRLHHEWAKRVLQHLVEGLEDELAMDAKPVIITASEASGGITWN